MKKLLFLAFMASAVMLGLFLGTGQPPLYAVAFPLLAWLSLFVLLYVLGIALVIAGIVIVARRDHLDATAASKIVASRAATKGCNPLKGDLWRKGDS